MKLRFHARGTALVQDLERMEAGVKAFLGRKYKEIAPDVWGFVPTGELAEVPAKAEYVKACKEGDLHPADETTAKYCGVSFDPHFGEPPPVSEEVSEHVALVEEPQEAAEHS